MRYSIRKSIFLRRWIVDAWPEPNHAVWVASFVTEEFAKRFLQACGVGIKQAERKP